MTGTSALKRDTKRRAGLARPSEVSPLATTVRARPSVAEPTERPARAACSARSQIWDFVLCAIGLRKCQVVFGLLASPTAISRPANSTGVRLLFTCFTSASRRAGHRHSPAGTFRTSSPRAWCRPSQGVPSWGRPERNKPLEAPLLFEGLVRGQNVRSRCPGGYAPPVVALLSHFGADNAPEPSERLRGRFL